jgi:hypothetical protein
MSRWTALFSVVLMVTGFALAASTLSFANSANQNPPAQLVQPSLDKNAKIPNRLLNEDYKICARQSNRQFSAEKRKFYCACRAAKLKDQFNMGEFLELQNKENHNPRKNKTYEKFITLAVMPCALEPLVQIEKENCFGSARMDVRISKPLPLCECMANEMRGFFISRGTPILLEKLATDAFGFSDPLNALWEDSRFEVARGQLTDQCLIRNRRNK